jgi:pimeloyl-ACP methyl ester carboxylesterase
MSSSTRIRNVRTSHGSLVVEESGEGGMPVLLIHGNSSCRSVFRRQLQSRLPDGHRLVTFDLPGHGQSSDAPDPVQSYTLPGLADAVLELVMHLGISEAVVMGWSLGGHIGIEMMPRFPGMRGLVITGTPPIRRGGMAEGFVASPQFQLASRSELSDADVEAFARAMFGEPVEPFLRDAIVRADERFRQRLFEAGRAGAGIDQRAAVESSGVLTAVVNGADDRLINLDYIDTVAFGNLWEGRCHRMSGIGHAPFWHASADYNSILERFLKDVR